MPKRFSTARGREFGDGVRAAIAGTGLTSRQICEKIGWDPGKLSDLLHGKGGCSEVDLAILLSFCHIAPGERDHLMAILGESSQRIWWQRYLYSKTFTLRTFLLCLATPKFPRDEVEDRVSRRLAMQEIFRQRLFSASRQPSGAVRFRRTLSL